MSTLRRYQFYYAVIDPALGDMCVQVQDTTDDCSSNPNYIPIPEYNGNYLWKYYDRETGKWYIDAAHTTEWSPN